MTFGLYSPGVRCVILPPMLPHARTERDHPGELYGHFAFCSVVLTAFAQLALTRRPLGEPWQLLVTFAGGALYLILAVLSPRWTDRGTENTKIAYFAGQTLLLTIVILLSPSRGFFGIVVLPLAAQSIFDLRWRGAVLVNLWLFALCVLSIGIPFGRGPAVSAALQFSPAFVFTIIFSILTARAFRHREAAVSLSAELAAANERLRIQSAQVDELATVRERHRLAREIHDGLGHYLTVINVQLEAAGSLLEQDPQRAAGALAKATRLSREALAEVRRSVADVHRDEPPGALAARIEALCVEAGDSARCAVTGSPRALATAAEHALFRAAQEGLTNVRKHAGDAPAELRLDYRERTRVTLRIANEGGGLSAPAAEASPTAGFGLRGMRERVELLGGKLNVTSRAGGGFELNVELPG